MTPFEHITAGGTDRPGTADAIPTMSAAASAAATRVATSSSSTGYRASRPVDAGSNTSSSSASSIYPTNDVVSKLVESGSTGSLYVVRRGLAQQGIQGPFATFIGDPSE